MHINLKTSGLQNPPPQLILSQEVFHVKIFQQLVGALVLSEQKASFGLSISELFMKCNPGTSLLKILLSYEMQESNLSYMTFPKSGMMQSGNVYRLHSLVTGIKGKDVSLLPTPLKSDGTKSGMFKSSKKLMKYLEIHTDRLIYQCQLNGLTAQQTVTMYETIMGFPKDWTEIESPQLAMQFRQTLPST